jgi:4-hydroxybutyrate CoA-transferase
MTPSKWMNARQALRQAIRPGNRIFFSIAAAQPQTLLRALAEDFASYQNVEIVNGYLLAGHPLAQEGLQPSFHCVSLQNSPPLKKDWEEGRIDFLPVRYSDIPRIFSPDGVCPVDVALIQVAPADREGRFSLGASTSLAYPIARGARTIVAEVNDRAPRTFGPCSFRADEIDFFVECSAPLIPYPEIRITEAERRIAGFVGERIPDGATLQLGIGNLPVAILECLGGKKDLGIHSGMLSDGIVDLAAKGVITNRRKTIYPGKIVTGELIGTEKLNRFSHENPLLEMHPASVTHNAQVLAQNAHFVAINSAVEIDLTGQINAESLNGVQISGVGGQFDFVEAAYFAPGGRSITAFLSSAGSGKVSRIVPRLAAGAVATVPRYMTDLVVTEYGVAELRGKSLSQRAEALISIAHPNFRESLRKALKRRRDL